MPASQYYAQFGEDRILDRIFRGKRQGNCVEVGGYDGVTGSNTYFFEKLGWHCLVVEPMPDFCAKIRAARTCDIAEVAASDKVGEVEFYVATGVETLSTMESNDEHLARIKSLSNEAVRKIKVKTNRLTDILRSHGMAQVDFLTIDVEGHEMSVLAGMSFLEISPRVVIIEDNSNGKDDAVNMYMRGQSYVRFKRTGCNDWYVRSDDELASSWNIARTTLDISLRQIRSRLGQLARR
jgi:FkbM family methyltransferase